MVLNSLLFSILLMSCAVILINIISKIRNALFKKNPDNIVEKKSRHKILWIILFNFTFLLLTDQNWSNGAQGFPFFPFLFLIILADIDILTFLLPIELLIAAFLSDLIQVQTAQQWFEKGLGFLLTAIILCLIYFLGKKYSQGEECSFGMGDVIYGSCIGLNLGWHDGLYALSYGLIMAGIYSAILMFIGKDRNSMIPISPFLLMGAAFIERI